MMMTLPPLQTTIENGCIVGRAPWLDAPVRTKLKRAARALAAQGHAACGALTDEHFAMLEGMSPYDIDTEAVGSLWGKIKKGAKKVGKGLKKATVATVKVAHKVTHNKAFEALHKKIQKMVPAPYDIFVKIHNKIAGATHKFIDKATKGDKGAKALAPSIRDVAAGKLDPKKLPALAKKAGIDPEEASAVAALTKLQNQAKAGDKKAAATISVMQMLEQAKAGKPGAAQRLVADADIRKFPGARSYKIKGKSGKQYQVAVIPA